VQHASSVAAAAVTVAIRSPSNAGADAHQTVEHLHIHVFGGRVLGPMLVKK
jgi:diadenosine tetraphosphate (Ap4A) HIT family hydrolase